jgi:hypothetical protein
VEKSKTQSFGIASAFTQLIKLLSNSSGLSESRQVDFIDEIDTPDLFPNEIPILEGDPYILLRIWTLVPAWQKADVAVLYS